MNEKESMNLCPKFGHCSASRCPLDPMMDKLKAYSDEPKCTLRKSTRYKIGKNSQLPHKGLTKQEYYFASTNDTNHQIKD